MDLAIYAHPFDLQALAGFGGLPRLRDLGFCEIALAASYHDGRWLQPWSPDGRVRFLEDGTVHFRPGTDYGVLRPRPSSAVAATGPSPLEWLCENAPAAGLRARAWAVCTHNSRLGAEHRELCVQNAFGDVYPYALCPAQPAVQQYVTGLARDLAAHPGLSSIEFEAFGWMGHRHGSHHDKASFTPRGLCDYALSLCFCSACERAIVHEGGDPAALRAWAAEVCRQQIEGACAMSPPAPLEATDADDPTWPVRSARLGVVAGLGAAVRAVVPPAVARAIQVHPNPLFTGSQLPVVQATGLMADEFVATAYGEGPAAIAQLLAGRDLFLVERRPKRLSIWPKAPQFTNDEDLVKVRDLARSRGVATIAVYHLGLLPWRTIERAARILSA